MATGNNISAKSVLGYVLLPRVIPRARNLFASGFGQVAFMMAHIYAMVRLLPENHPYLKKDNIGGFGIRHVMAAAASNLKWNRKHADQITIFGATVVGAVLIVLQIISVIYSFLFRPAMAQVAPFSSFFNTPKPFNDIALNLLDRMFGVPDMFCNNAGDCTSYNPMIPTPFHDGLHAMFQFYSLGILVVGFLIFLYYIVIVVGETATSGTPFGQRFQNIWVPIRLVVAIGLLVPLNYGLNSAQYITLYAAKWGSGFATNAWIQFNRAVANQETVFKGNQFGVGGANPIGEKESLIARPRSPDFTPVIQFVSLAHACDYSYEGTLRVKPYFVKQPQAGIGTPESFKEITIATTYQEGLDFYGNGDIVIRFGERNESKYPDDKGNVAPLCGDLRVHVGDVANKGMGATIGGPEMVQQAYFDQITKLWFNDTAAKNLAYRFIEWATPGGEPCDILPLQGAPGRPHCDKNYPPTIVKQMIINRYNAEIAKTVQKAWNLFRKTGIGTELTEEIHDRGWGGAGIWYNTIARINGGFMDAIQAVPSASIDEYPAIMVKVRKENEASNNDSTGINIFEPNVKEGQEIKSLSTMELRQAQNLSRYYKYWAAGVVNQDNEDKVITGNAFKDAMNFIFGTSGLLAMREDNAGIHPLAQLSAVGKSLVDNAIRNIGLSSGFAFMGGLLSQLEMSKGGAASQMASDVLSSTAFIGLTAGVILFYILPFMPFLYFFFAVGEWVKGIFEAMVGVPLWALAHLKLDGEGLAGDSAITGYYLLLDIFLRPILILFGLMAAMIIFTMQVRTLHFIWDIVVANLTGYEKDPAVDMFGLLQLSRGEIDEFFFTVIYAIIVYMMATASFKLIDAIPDNLMRYMGSPASSFYDMHKDEQIGQLNRYAAYGGISYVNPAVQGLTGGARAAGEGLGGLLKSMGPKPPPAPPAAP